MHELNTTALPRALGITMVPEGLRGRRGRRVRMQRMGMNVGWNVGWVARCVCVCVCGGGVELAHAFA
jgi:hypothetical protein